MAQHPGSGPSPERPDQPPTTPAEERNERIAVTSAVLGPILLLLLLAFVVPGIGADTRAGINIPSTSTSTPSPQPSTVTTKTPPPHKTTFTGMKGGDVATFPGQTHANRRFDITTTPLVAQVDSSNRPEVCTTSSIVNTQSQDEKYSLFEWKLQDPNGVIHQTKVPPTVSKDTIGTGKLAPGEEASGQVCFDIDPVRIPGEYVVLYRSTDTPNAGRLGWVNTL